jgi:ribosome maturation factor RimP
VGLRPLFFLVGDKETTQAAQTHAPAEPRDNELQAKIEERLNRFEPDVEVLRADVVGGRASRGLRLFIDRPGGVDHELCARVTQHLRDLLVDYSLEVSSPGPSRPLTKPEHYRRFVGRRVRISTREAIDGRSEFKGELVEAGDESVAVSGHWGKVSIPLDRIRRSNLVPQPVEAKPPGGRK